MAFNKEQVEAVKKWVHKMRLVCPICKARAPKFFRDFFQLGQLSSPERSPTGVENCLFLGLACSYCGLLWLVDPQVGEIPLHEKKAPPPPPKMEPDSQESP